MAIKNHRFKVGELVECDYGAFSDKKHPDGHIPPEIVKKRLVVILNNKLNRLVLVVPISSKIDQTSISKGLHVEICTTYFPKTDHYDERKRWAKSELIQAVSIDRLHLVNFNRKPIIKVLPREVVEEIQRAVIKAINAHNLFEN